MRLTFGKMFDEITLGFVLAITFSATSGLSEPFTEDAFQRISETVFGPVIETYDIPGIAVGVTYKGETYIYTHGLAVQDPPQPVTADTLFELGSVSKLFNAALASLANERELFSLDSAVSTEVPAIEGSAFDAITLYDLAAHANGGLPLQVPLAIRSDADLTQWLMNWTTENDARAIRGYSNLSIGLLGKITADALGSDYETALETELLSELGLKNTYITVPDSAMPHYAFGYNRFGNAPTRSALSFLDAEAYGVKSSLTDMVRFLDAHLGVIPVAEEVSVAFSRTLQERYDTIHYAQAMIWEAYPWPVSTEELVSGNSTQMSLTPQPITPRAAPLLGPIFYNKTGATTGFGAYVAMVPSEKIGVVVLANRNYPNPVRAEATLTLITEILSTN